MTTRRFGIVGDPDGPDRQRIVLEMEPSGVVSWRIWEGDGLAALDLGGDTFEERGKEQLDRAAAELLAGDWEELT